MSKKYVQKHCLTAPPFPHQLISYLCTVYDNTTLSIKGSCDDDIIDTLQFRFTNRTPSNSLNLTTKKGFTYGKM